MSRIGRLPVQVPAGVTVEYNGGTFKAKGPKGELSRIINERHIAVKIEGASIEVQRDSENKEVKAKHGLYRQLINNMVKGVKDPFVKTLIVNGVGWKVAVNGGKLVMNIGFSHPVEIVPPEGVTLACPNITTITVTGIDKEKVGQTAAVIRSKRKVEPYHAYGIRYSDEVVIRKEGKTGK